MRHLSENDRYDDRPTHLSAGAIGRRKAHEREVLKTISMIVVKNV
jgi:hypothetical protein